MAINIKCDTTEEAAYIGEAINVFQSEAGPLPYLNPVETTIAVGDEKYTAWYTDDGETSEEMYSFYGLEAPEYDEEDEEEDDECDD